MRRIKTALMPLLLALMLIIYGCKGGNSVEDDLPTSPTAFETQRSEYMALQVDVEQAYYERNYQALQARAKIKALRAEYVEAERKKRLAALEDESKRRQATLSRAQAYVGRAKTYEITYYTAQCEGCTGQSASGVWVTGSTHWQGYRVLAAPPEIPFYSIMRVTSPDGSTFDGIVLDRGGAIKGARLDVLTATKTEAYANGRHKAQVQVVRRGK